jgi:hypothetical protein
MENSLCFNNFLFQAFLVAWIERKIRDMERYEEAMWPESALSFGHCLLSALSASTIGTCIISDHHGISVRLLSNRSVH